METGKRSPPVRLTTSVGRRHFASRIGTVTRITNTAFGTEKRQVIRVEFERTRTTKPNCGCQPVLQLQSRSRESSKLPSESQKSRSGLTVLCGRSKLRPSGTYGRLATFWSPVWRIAARPSTITIPDDHDIGQPNLWGEGGIKGDGNGNGGGYIFHPEYVKMVERCQTAHLPDPFDPKPIAQGINVYFTSLIVGGVDFAILEDRKFKTGPRGKVPKMGPRPDHIIDPKYRPADIDLESFVLLGKRQLSFLRHWSEDWQGVEMKAVLSQSPFCNAAHLHGGKDNRLVADLDSNGWPQTPRNHALKEIRKAFAVHLAGDQHLATLLQHGIDQWNDSVYSMTSPAIVNSIYSRYWWPPNEKPGDNRDETNPLPFTGDYLDGFHNKLTMHAYANPDSNDKGFGAGFAVARFDKKERTITFECWPRFADLTQPDAKQFAGWPKTVRQIDNYNPNDWVPLPKLIFRTPNPVIQIVDDATGKPLYTLRIRGTEYQPRVPADGRWTIKIGRERAETMIRSGIPSKSNIRKIEIDY